MKMEKWMLISKENQQMIAIACKVAGIDFENECIESEGCTINDNSPWMTRDEAAEYSKVSTDTIDNWCSQGFIMKAKLGTGRAGAVLIDRESLTKFLKSKIVNRKKRNATVSQSPKGGYRVQY